MALANDTVMLFLLLMPGFLSSIILNMIVVRKPPSEFLLVIEALVFSFFIYVCWGLLSGQVLVSLGDSGGISPRVISRWALIGVVVLSVSIPVVLGALLTHDVPLRILRKLKVTRRTERGSVWLDMFLDQRRYIVVNFTDGRQLFGWPQYYSDDFNEGMLYLYDPAWIDEKGNYLWLGVHGLFIPSHAGVESIAFTDVREDNAEPDAYARITPARISEPVSPSSSGPQADKERAQSPSGYTGQASYRPDTSAEKE